MQRATLAISATCLVLLGVLALLWPPIRPHATLIYVVAVLLMCVASLSGQSRLRDRRVPNAWRLTSGWARLQAALAIVALASMGIGFVLPNRFQPEAMGWTWLGMGLVGYSWLVSLLRLEREGVPKDSLGKD